jgi:hypothetical protein
MPCAIPIGNRRVLYNSWFVGLIKSMLANKIKKDIPSKMAVYLNIFVII